MPGLADTQPTQPDPDSEGRIPYFQPPAGEEQTESGTDGDR